MRFNVEGTALVRSIIATIPALMICVAYWGPMFLRRESVLLLHEELQMFRIAKLMDLDEEVAVDKRIFPNDERLLLEAWREPLSEEDLKNFDGTLEGAVKLRVSRHLFWKWFDKIFLVEAGLAFVLICAILFLHF
jgi:hypothetical protein